MWFTSTRAYAFLAVTPMVDVKRVSTIPSNYKSGFAPGGAVLALVKDVGLSYVTAHERSKTRGLPHHRSERVL